MGEGCSGRARDTKEFTGGQSKTNGCLRAHLEPGRACSGLSVLARLYYNACCSMLRAETYNAHGRLLVMTGYLQDNGSGSKPCHPVSRDRGEQKGTNRQRTEDKTGSGRSRRGTRQREGQRVDVHQATLALESAGQPAKLG